MRVLTTKIWTAWLFMLAFAVFCTVAQAQDKPMEPGARAALIVSLKEVVSANARNQTDAVAIGKKWDARKDLSGRSKSDVIDLLYDDVKEVIKDPGILYQIYSIFAFYKNIPDKPAAKFKPATSKAAAVKQLVELTYKMHHYVGIEEQLAALPGANKETPETKAMIAEQKTKTLEAFDNALKSNRKLSAAEKEFVKTNYDRLYEMTEQIIDETIEKNFPVEKWIREGLRRGYTQKFTLAELNKLIPYFQSETGENVLNHLRLTNMKDLIVGNGGKVEFTAAEQAEADIFAAGPAGKKFVTVFLKDAVAYEEAQEVIARRNPNADGFGIYQEAGLHGLFERFVRENYKK